MSKLKVYFFRHGLTNRNVGGRCCGRVNALVSEEGRKELYNLYENYEYPVVEKVYSSPAIRCQETASIFFPEQEPEIIEEFWEYDFGKAEDHPVTELAKWPEFEKWLNQDPDCCYEGGETLLGARFRAQAAMTRVVMDCIRNNLKEVAVVAHGEILYLLMTACLETDVPWAEFQLCPNGMGYMVELDKKGWFKEQKMQFIAFLPEGAERPKAEDSPYFSKKKLAEWLEEDDEEEEEIEEDDGEEAEEMDEEEEALAGGEK
jgi:alpha-ribazole phosphatase